MNGSGTVDGVLSFPNMVELLVLAMPSDSCSQGCGRQRWICVLASGSWRVPEWEVRVRSGGGGETVAGRSTVTMRRRVRRGGLTVPVVRVSVHPGLVDGPWGRATMRGDAEPPGQLGWRCPRSDPAVGRAGRRRSADVVAGAGGAAGGRHRSRR